MIVSLRGFGGTWEDWCDEAIANGRLDESQRARCKSGGLCAVSPPYTAWGATCRGIPYVGYDQGLLAKAVQAASAITSVEAAVFTAGISTIPQGGPQALIGTVMGGAQAARDVVSAARDIASGAAGKTAAPPQQKPVMAGFSTPVAVSLLAGVVGLVFVIMERRAKR